jgi:hypothetical protein
MEDDVMAVGKTLTVFLNADLKKFNAGMAQAQGGLKGFAAGMKNLLGPAAIGAGIAIAGLATKMAVDGVQAAMANEESLVKLTNTLENLGLAHNTEQIEAYIYQLERSLGVADTELRPAYQKLVVATGNVEDANKALGLALDVSASSGKSLEQVTEALSKAFSGQIAGLSRLNLGIDAATIRSGDMNLILQKLADTTAGAAAASADTLTGRMQVLQTAVDNLGEAFGQGLVNSLKKGTEGTGQAVQDMAKLEEGLTNIGESTGDAALGIAGYIVELNNINTAVNDAAKGNSIFATALDEALTILNPFSVLTDAASGIMGIFADETDAASDAIDDSAASAYNAVPGWNALSTAINTASMRTDEYLQRNGVKLKLIREENLGYQDAAARLNNLNNWTATVDTTTKKLTGSRGVASAATKELTKDEKKLIQAYEDGETALAKRGDQLLAEVDNLNAARDAIKDYTTEMAGNILAGINLGTAYEAQFNDQGEKTGASLLEGFNKQIAQAEYFGGVLTAIKAQGADQGLIEQIASLGPETGAMLGQQILDEGLVPTLSEKWVSVNAAVNELAKGLIPEGLLAGEQMAISTVQGLAEGIQKDKKSLTKLGKQVGKIVGAKFKAQLADDVAEAIRSVEAQATAARAEAIATAQAQQAVITDQAVAQAISQIITRGDQRLGQLTRPLVA